ncbi:MAG: AAA family ATPase, partial [Streptosporangiaceae bacterium]
MIRIWLLGRSAVSRDGREVAARDFGGALARRLLRLLALRRGTLVSKDLIAEVLWPSTPPADPAANIEVLISRLRRALGDRGVIRTGPGGYLLPDGPGCWVDAEAFLAAVRAGRSRLRGTPAAALNSFRDALGIWRGEPLPEDTYADWAQADSRQLALAHLEALDGAAAAALECAALDRGSRVAEAAGAASEAAAWARQAVAADPLRESSVLLLARALDAACDRAGALTALDEYRDRLAAETGLSPTSEATGLRQLILTRPATGPTPILRQGPFLGRDEECAVITSAATGHGPRAVLVSGPPGVGKSALLAAAARRSGVPALAVQAFVADRDQAWSLAARLLCRAASQVAGPLSALLPGPEAAALAAAVPGLTGLPNVPAGYVGDPAAERTRALTLRAAIRLIAAVAQPRCLIVADDLQWADPASLTMLGLLLRRLDSVGLAAGYRQEAAAGADLAAALGLPAKRVAEITLGPLPDGLIADLFSDRRMAAAVGRQTARGPFTATEVIAALARRATVTRDAAGRWRLADDRPRAGAEQRAADRAAADRAAADR